MQTLNQNLLEPTADNPLTNLEIRTMIKIAYIIRPRDDVEWQVVKQVFDAQGVSPEERSWKALLGRLNGLTFSKQCRLLYVCGYLSILIAVFLIKDRNLTKSSVSIGWSLNLLLIVYIVPPLTAQQLIPYGLTGQPRSRMS